VITPRNGIGGAAAIAALLLCACAAEGDAGDPPVARAFDRELYWSDLRQVIPLESTPEDSAAMARQFIDNWLREQVVLHQAEQNLGDEQRSMEARIEDYRRSLLTYAYEEALVGQKLDTALSNAELEAYFEANRKDFVLKDNIVRLRWFKVREQDKRTLRKVEDLWRSDKEKDRHDLELWLAAHGSPITDSHDQWVPFTEVLAQVPLEVDNPTDWLPRQGKVMARDSVNTYFVEFLEHRLSDGLSPFPLVRERIRAILLNQRKLQLIERMRNDLYQDALDRKDIEVL
jgi:hypothetical protein